MIRIKWAQFQSTSRDVADPAPVRIAWFKHRIKNVSCLAVSVWPDDPPVLNFNLGKAFEVLAQKHENPLKNIERFKPCDYAWYVMGVRYWLVGFGADNR